MTPVVIVTYGNSAALKQYMQIEALVSPSRRTMRHGGSQLTYILSNGLVGYMFLRDTFSLHTSNDVLWL